MSMRRENRTVVTVTTPLEDAATGTVIGTNAT